ncbi:Peroxisomal membrane protein PAS20 [Rhizina undulata]
MTAPTTAPAPAAPSTTSAVPALPARPSSLTNSSAVSRLGAPATATSSPYGAYNRPGYGMGAMGAMGSSYGSYGSYGGYSSPYSRFGGYGGGMYGGMGGYGGFGGFGIPGGDPNDPNTNSLTRGMESSTAATFQMIESIVGAFGGFAQMLESTFMATHSSFFAMVQVAEQFGNLRNTLGSVLGIFTVMRWIRMLFAKITGRPMPASSKDLTPGNFAAFQGAGRSGIPKPSKKPFFFFLVAIFGLPYLMGKLIRALASKQEEQQRQLASAQGASEMTDPSKLEFCRVMYDFTPEVNNGIELEVKKGDLVAVLSKADPVGNPSQWWRCRARDARVGYLPGPYLEAIVRRPGGENGSRSATMTSEMASIVKDTKPGDISLESFQKSQFYS